MEVTPLMRLGSIMTRHSGLLPVLPDPVKEGAEAAPGDGDPGPQPLARPALSRGPDKHVATLIQVAEQRPPEQQRVSSERLGSGHTYPEMREAVDGSKQISGEPGSTETSGTGIPNSLLTPGREYLMCDEQAALT